MKNFILNMAKTFLVVGIDYLLFFLFYQAYFNIKWFGTQFNQYYLIQDEAILTVSLIGEISIILGFLTMLLGLIAHDRHSKYVQNNEPIVDQFIEEAKEEIKKEDQNNEPPADEFIIDPPSFLINNKQQLNETSISDFFRNLPDRKITITLDQKTDEE